MFSMKKGTRSVKEDCSKKASSKHWIGKLNFPREIKIVYIIRCEI